jgi:iron complex outermembrane receptor protein
VSWQIKQCICLLAGLGSLGLRGDEVADEPVTEMPALVVWAMQTEPTLDRIPAAVSLIPAEAIQRGTQQLSLEESLRGVPGVFVLNPTNFAQDTRIAIRGFGARADFGIRGIRLVVDGIPSTLPDGQGEVDGIDFGSAGRIEIIRGPASALYGASSGGVILMETESAPVEPFLETRLSGGDDGFGKAQVKAGGQAGPLSYLLHGSRLEFDGFRDHSRTENWKFNSKLCFRLDDSSSLTATVNLIDMPQQDDPGGLTLAEARSNPRQARDRNLLFDAGESVRQRKVGLLYRKDWLQRHRLELNSYHVHRDFSGRLPFESGGQISFSREYSGGGFQYGFTGDRIAVVAGADTGLQADARKNYDNLSGTRGSLVLDQDEQAWALGAYLHAAIDVLPAVTASASLRHDRVEFSVEDRFIADGDDSGDIDFSETSPMAGLIWRLHPGLSMFANVSTSFETPTTTEFDNPAGGGFNTRLKPQTATNYELGARGQTEVLSRPLRFDLALFQIEIDDALVPYTLSPFPGREFFRNAGASRHCGFEGALSVYVSPRLTASIAYTWSDFFYTSFESPSGDFSGNRIPGIPEHLADFSLRYEHDNGAYFQWSTRWVGETVADDGNTTLIDAYTTSDLRIGFDLQAEAWTFSPFLGINNLFDEAYPANIRINAFGGRYFEPAPERTLYAGFRVRFSFP